MDSRLSNGIAVAAIGAAAILAGVVILATNPTQVDHSFGWALIVIGAIVVIIGGGIPFLQSKRADPRPQELGATARVVCDADYDGGSAIYVVLDVSNPGGDVVKNARARLVSIMPIAERADYLDTLPQFQFEEGLLQWSSAFGGAEVATFKTRATLDVLAFENNDQSALVVYVLPGIRGKRNLLLEAADWWEIEIEVYAESGHHGTGRFRIRRGVEKVCVAVSRNGTLYEPELEELVIDHDGGVDLELVFSHSGFRVAAVEGGDGVGGSVYEATVWNAVITNRSAENVSLQLTLHLALRTGSVPLEVPGCDLLSDGDLKVQDPFNISAKSSLAGALVFRNVFPSDPDNDYDDNRLNRIVDRQKSTIELRDLISDRRVSVKLGRRGIAEPA